MKLLYSVAMFWGLLLFGNALALEPGRYLISSYETSFCNGKDCYSPFRGMLLIIGEHGKPELKIATLADDDAPIKVLETNIISPKDPKDESFILQAKWEISEVNNHAPQNAPQEIIKITHSLTFSFSNVSGVGVDFALGSTGITSLTASIGKDLSDTDSKAEKK